MQTFKVSDVQFAALNAQLKEAKDLKSRGEQISEAAKSRLLTWLRKERSYDVESQPAGTIVIIQLNGSDCFKIERKGRSSIDIQRLRVERKDVAEEFRTESVATYIDAL